MNLTKISLIIGLIIVANILFLWIKSILKKNAYDSEIWFRLNDYFDMYDLIGKEIDTGRKNKYRMIFYGHFIIIFALIMVAILM